MRRDALRTTGEEWEVKYSSSTTELEGVWSERDGLQTRVDELTETVEAKERQIAEEKEAKAKALAALEKKM